MRASGPDGVHVVAHDAVTGAIRWSSAPVPEPEGDLDSTVFVTTDGGREYAVLATTGAGEDNGVDKPARSTHLYVYGTDSSGPVTAEREISLPVAVGDYWAQSDGRVFLENGDGVTVVRVADGSMTSYPEDDGELRPPKDCPHAIGSCTDRVNVVAMTANGPLVQGFQAFWVPGGWISDDVVPAGASPNEGFRNVEIVASPDGEAILAGWPTEDPTEWLWALHDGATGRVRGSVVCDLDSAAHGPSGLTPVVSGRFLVAGFAAFDLRTGQGQCFAETAGRRAIELTAVAADGTAYGTAGSEDTPVSVSLSTGRATPLPDGTTIPDGVAAGSAYLGTATNGGESILVFPPA
ncbi:hypothetical protein GCM10017786_29160 [Amycolatopsis deserti]|uniref:Uncharacterized protein n=1 Tax=Amycolatopsis deserti TaxID=185696 RepID=A0ABQ3IV07_9PSEU|nr:hypothetical protein [Amycolatopsis deserti]GHE94299.1 hypothetical protein GCM10017786_29160 [Amycolatopsis deserti]